MQASSRPPRFTLINELYALGQDIQAAGGRPILVGGWVRDALLNMTHPKDYDLEVYGLEAEHLRKVLRKHGPVHLVGRHFGVFKLNTSEAEYDVSLPRRESKTGPGHKGFRVETNGGLTFEQASARRDFTINAMGYDFLGGELLDYWGGEAHLRERLLRHVGPAFSEDPLRVLRAMQFAGRFGLRIAAETIALCREQDLSELPRERLWEEFKKLLLRSPRPSQGLLYAGPLGILPTFPELEALHQAQGGVAEVEGGADWRHTLAVVDATAALRTGRDGDDMPLMLAALCHRMGGHGPDASSVRVAAAQAFLERLTNEAAVLKPTLALIADLHTPEVLHALPPAELPGALRRLALRARLPDLFRLAQAHHAAESPDPAPEHRVGTLLMRQARDLGVWDAPPEPLLKGRHLQGLGMHPGKAMGDLLRQAFEAQLDGAFTTVEGALDWLRAAGLDVPAEGGAEPRQGRGRQNPGSRQR